MEQKRSLKDLLFGTSLTTYQVYSIWTDGAPVYVGYTSKDLKAAIQNLAKHGIDFPTNDDSYILLEGEPLLSVGEAKARKTVRKEEYNLCEAIKEVR